MVDRVLIEVNSGVAVAVSKPGGKFGPLGCSKASTVTSPEFVAQVASWGYIDITVCKVQCFILRLP